MMDATPALTVLTLLAGVVTGALSAAFGVGGAVVSTPAIRLLGVTAAFAIATTIPAILPSAVSGTARYGREGLIRWPVVAWTAVPGAVAAVGGAELSGSVPGDGHWLMVASALLLGFTAARMARGGSPAGGGGVAAPVEAPRLDRPGVLVPVGLAAGLLSGLLGVGGGTVLVPAFSEVVRLPLKAAIATSLACVGLLAVPATLTHWSLGGIDWRTAGLLSLGVVPGARLGAAAAIRASDARLRRAVAAVLGLVALVYLVSELAALSR
ncbi:MAG: sulfite exporter TauE/SafE family protein [Acidimicrobiales bacterium]